MNQIVKRTSISMLILAVSMFLSCSEELKVEPFTYSKLFTGENSKTWVFDHYAFVEVGQSPQNGGLNSCRQDDRYTFYRNSERGYEITNGPRKCALSEPDLILSDSWEYSSGTTTLNVELAFFPYGKLPYIVKKLDEDDLVLEIFLDTDNTFSYQFYFEALQDD